MVEVFARGKELDDCGEDVAANELFGGEVTENVEPPKLDPGEVHGFLLKGDGRPNVNVDGVCRFVCCCPCG